MDKFVLSESQQEKVKEFDKEHKKCRKDVHMGTDGNYAITYMFTPGGIGTIVEIKCNYCGEGLNITEYENW